MLMTTNVVSRAAPAADLVVANCAPPSARCRLLIRSVCVFGKARNARASPRRVASLVEPPCAARKNPGALRGKISNLLLSVKGKVSRSKKADRMT
ncbi:unnamed protein product [Lasius platythorax]|uniref:Uncharacterized protein n=1 Tax=Lasius platythorax TaxID=488582 RepID=A0AAV2NVU9_9HYME